MFCLRRVSRWPRGGSDVDGRDGAQHGDAATGSRRGRGRIAGGDDATVGGGVLERPDGDRPLAVPGGGRRLTCCWRRCQRDVQLQPAGPPGRRRAGCDQVDADPAVRRLDLATNVLTAVAAGAGGGAAADPLRGGAGAGRCCRWSRGWASRRRRWRPPLPVVAAHDGGPPGDRLRPGAPSLRRAVHAGQPREQKYKARPLIDTVICRGGDLVGSLAVHRAAGAGAGPAGVALVGAAGGGAVAGAGVFAGARQRRGGSQTPGPPTDSSSR